MKKCMKNCENCENSRFDNYSDGACMVSYKRLRVIYRTDKCEEWEKRSKNEATMHKR